MEWNGMKPNQLFAIISERLQFSDWHFFFSFFFLLVCVFRFISLLCYLTSRTHHSNFISNTVWFSFVRVYMNIWMFVHGTHTSTTQNHTKPSMLNFSLQLFRMNKYRGCSCRMTNIQVHFDFISPYTHIFIGIIPHFHDFFRFFSVLFCIHFFFSILVEFSSIHISFAIFLAHFHVDRSSMPSVLYRNRVDVAVAVFFSRLHCWSFWLLTLWFF